MLLNFYFSSVNLSYINLIIRLKNLEGKKEKFPIPTHVKFI